MIIFTPLLEIPIELLMYKGIKTVLRFNMSSMYEGIETVSNLIPSYDIINNPALHDYNGINFDAFYCSHVIENDAAFIDLMKIMIPANLNPDCLIHIMIKQSEFRDVVTETLIKLIQQRYGYNCYIVNEIEDFIYTDESDFSIPGLFVFEQDRGRWLMLNNVGEDNE